jgi:NADP-dependent aldehyde dehydrogenase
MGSINPTIFLPNALAWRSDELADGFVNSVTLGAGQFCTNPGLVLIEDSENARRFIDAVRARMEARDPGVLLNASIESGLARAVDGTLQKPSVTRLTGGTVVEGTPYCYANTVMQTTSAALRADPDLQNEHFGPVTLFALCESFDDLKATIPALHGSLTAAIHAEKDELDAADELAGLLREKVGRLIWNGYPTGVEVVYSMQHGGPYPATTAPATTSVGMTAIKRFMRPVAFQDAPQQSLPPALKNANPLNIWRIVDDKLTRAPF